MSPYSQLHKFVSIQEGQGASLLQRPQQSSTRRGRRASISVVEKADDDKRRKSSVRAKKAGRRASLVEASVDMGPLLQAAAPPPTTGQRVEAKKGRRKSVVEVSTEQRSKLISRLQAANPLCTKALPRGADLAWSDEQLEMFYGSAGAVMPDGWQANDDGDESKDGKTKDKRRRRRKSVERGAEFDQSCSAPKDPLRTPTEKGGGGKTRHRSRRRSIA